MSAADLAALAVPCVLLMLAVTVLIADVVPESGSRRGIGAFVVAGLVVLLGASFYLPMGPAFGGVYVRDAFTALVERLLLLTGVLATLGSIDHADRRFPGRQGEYYLLLLSSLSGMTLLAGARELVLMVVSFELMGVPLYVLAAMHKDQRRGVEGSVKLYLTGAVSAAVTMYGLSFLVGAAGSTQYETLAATPSSPYLVVGLLLTLVGMAYKVGAVPFHLWVPDTYEAAPAPFVAFLSVAPKIAGFAALSRLLLTAMPNHQPLWAMLLLIAALLSMILGNLLAIPQSNVRRLLAYSGIGHVGLLLVALMVGQADTIGTMLFYLLTYIGANMGAFFVADLAGAGAGEALPDWAGLARRNPGLALAMLMCLLSLGGIPFVAGFWGKMLLFWSLWQAGYTWIVLLGATLAVVGLFYYMRVARSMYMEPAKDERPVAVPVASAWAIGLSVALIIIIGIYPRPFLDAAALAGAALLR